MLNTACLVLKEKKMPAELKIPVGLVCLSALLAVGLVNVTSLEAQASPTEAPPKPSAEIYLGNSYRYYQLGRYADSIDAARAALKQRKDYAAAWNNIAASYNAMGLFEDGERAAEEAVRLQPGDELAQNNLAWAKLNLASTPEGYLSRSYVYYTQGKFEESIEAAQAALNLRPDYPEAWNNIAAAYNSMSRWTEGIQAAEQAIRLRPDYTLARNNLAWAQSQLANRTNGVHK